MTLKHSLPLLALLLAGCASAAQPPLPVCDGRHRRAANPNGSVLDTSTAPTTPRPSGLSSTSSPSSLPGCGA